MLTEGASAKLLGTRLSLCFNHTHSTLVKSLVTFALSIFFNFFFLTLIFFMLKKFCKQFFQKIT